MPRLAHDEEAIAVLDEKRRSRVRRSVARRRLERLPHALPRLQFDAAELAALVDAVEMAVLKEGRRTDGTDRLAGVAAPYFGDGCLVGGEFQQHRAIADSSGEQ